MQNINERPQTLNGQLFKGMTLALWALMVVFFVVGIAGLVWDLSDTMILGTFGLDKGSAVGCLIIALVVSGVTVWQTAVGVKKHNRLLAERIKEDLSNGI